MKKQLNGNFYFLLLLLIFLISFEKALQIDSNYLNAWYGKGIALRNLGKSEKAIEWLLFFLFLFLLLLLF